MKINYLRSETRGTRACVAATVVWEDSDRPTRHIYFEVDEAFAGDLSPDPHAFLVGCVLPAMRHGEQRIAIAEPICPELRRGLVTAMDWLCQWYGPPRRTVRIETAPGTRLPSPRSSSRAVSFLSGGVDSLATLRANRRDFPLDHPCSIKNCLMVHGFDIGGVERTGDEANCFHQVVAAMVPVAEDAAVGLIPVRTNIRHLDDNLGFWMYEFHGAALASVAHAFSGRFSVASIASSFDISNMRPAGSHPLLDPNYSSTELKITHDGVRFTRLDKVKLVAGWDAALQSLRVCTENPSCMLNCGRCEKCIRTMTELQVLGRLADTQVFPEKVVSKAMLSGITITDDYQESCYRDLALPLRAKGWDDLAEVIEKKLDAYHRQRAWEKEEDWKGAVKRFDRHYLGSSLFRGYSAMRHQVVK